MSNYPYITQKITIWRVTTFRGLASLIYNLGEEIGFFMGGISTVRLVEMPPLQSRASLISTLKCL